MAMLPTAVQKVVLVARLSEAVIPSPPPSTGELVDHVLHQPIAGVETVALGQHRSHRVVQQGATGYARAALEGEPHQCVAQGMPFGAEIRSAIARGTVHDPRPVALIHRDPAQAITALPLILGLRGLDLEQYPLEARRVSR